MKALIASLGLLTLVACGSGQDAATNSPTSSEASDSGAGAGSENAVQMKLIAFKPDKLEVAKGTEVTWTQEDAGFHTATSGTVKVNASGEIATTPSGEFKSAQLKTGETFSHTFEKAGTFPYFCEIHPATMRGEITVSN